MEINLARNDVEKVVNYLKEYSGICVTVENVKKAHTCERLSKQFILAREISKSMTTRERLTVIAYNLMIGMEEFSGYSHEELLDYVGLTESEYKEIMGCEESEEE